MARCYSALSVILLFLSGCYHDDGRTELKCGNPIIGLQFIGYAPVDVDTFIVRKYRANNNYSTLIDTFLVDNSLWKQTVHSDTTETYNINNSKQITEGFDWEIFVPAKSKTYRLSEIIIEKKTIRCPNEADCLCSNDITSLKLNNQLYLPQKQTNPGFHFVSLKN